MSNSNRLTIHFAILGVALMAIGFGSMIETASIWRAIAFDLFFVSIGLKLGATLWLR